MRSSTRYLRTSALSALALAAATLTTLSSTSAQDAQPTPLKIENALVTLFEQAEIPARDAGLLTELKVSEGDRVTKGQVVGKVDDEDARLALAKAAAEEQIAATTATNDVKVRLADKEAKVATAELKRSLDAVERIERSISRSEIEKLQLEADRGLLSVENAQHEVTIAKQTRELKKAELAVAQQVVDRRQITSPLDGVVVQLHYRRGEWVKPGEPVLRVVRIDRMRAEAFVPAGRPVGDWTGRTVKFYADASGIERAPFVGKLVFVSPEIDPVNGQIRVWAEIENRNQELRPGERGTLELGPPAVVGTPAAAPASR